MPLEDVMHIKTNEIGIVPSTKELLPVLQSVQNIHHKRYDRNSSPFNLNR